MGVPPKLKAVFANQGYAEIKDFAAAIGIDYANVLRAVQRGDIPAVNVGLGSKRAVWRLYEEPIAEWFASRSNSTGPGNATAVHRSSNVAAGVFQIRGETG